jgi:hypothetical protein
VNHRGTREPGGPLKTPTAKWASVRGRGRALHAKIKLKMAGFNDLLKSGGRGLQPISIGGWDPQTINGYNGHLLARRARQLTQRDEQAPLLSWRYAIAAHRTCGCCGGLKGPTRTTRSRGRLTNKKARWFVEPFRFRCSLLSAEDARWGGSKVRLHQPRDWAEGHGHLWHIATVRCEAPIWSLMEA